MFENSGTTAAFIGFFEPYLGSKFSKHTCHERLRTESELDSEESELDSEVKELPTAAGAFVANFPFCITNDQ